MSVDAPTRILEAKCSCGSIHFTVNIPVSALPLPVLLCHCTLCRYRSGAPCIFHSPLPKDVRPVFVSPSKQENLTAHLFEGAPSSWNICSTCGCHVASIGQDDGSWTVASSVFTDHNPENFRIKTHVYSGSSFDKGFATILSHVGGQQLGDWNPPEDDPTAKTMVPEREYDDQGQERLRAECYCGGVSFTIGRPTKEVLSDEYLRGFVSPLDPNKWIALYDACIDCRLVNGTHVIGWTFVPLSSCNPPIARDIKIGTSKTYSTSAGVVRSFCGECGATIFYTAEERFPADGKDVVDVATGILRAKEGAMADTWLTWRTNLAWPLDGKQYDADFAEGLEEGLKKWTMEHYGRELHVPVPATDPTGS